MNIFKNRTFRWWQVGILKGALLFIGIAIGSYWPEVFTPYIPGLVIAGLLMGAYTAYATVGRD
jgi:hypothetical protein